MDEQKVKKIIDKYEAIEVVSENGYLYFYLNDTLKHDKDVAFSAAYAESDAIDFLPEKLLHDKGFILKLVQERPEVVANISTRLQDNAEIMFEAITQNGDTLKYASDRLKNNALIVLEAVKYSSDTISFASEELQQIAVNEENAEENLTAFIKAEKLLKKLQKEIKNKNTVVKNKMKI